MSIGYRFFIQLIQVAGAELNIEKRPRVVHENILLFLQTTQLIQTLSKQTKINVNEGAING